MTVKIHGKDYKTVAERLNEFHGEHKDGSINTEIIKELSSEEFVTIKATVIIGSGAVGSRTFTGHAREVFSKIGINSTSAYENCETSAIGRALASAGYMGSEFASADEVANAISGQAKKGYNKLPEPQTKPEAGKDKPDPLQAMYDRLHKAHNMLHDKETGDQAFNAILGNNGFEMVSEIKNIEVGNKILKEMTDYYKANKDVDKLFKTGKVKKGVDA